MRCHTEYGFGGEEGEDFGAGAETTTEVIASGLTQDAGLGGLTGIV